MMQLNTNTHARAPKVNEDFELWLNRKNFSSEVVDALYQAYEYGYIKGRSIGYDFGYEDAKFEVGVEVDG
jgi:hypothetical protein